MKTNRLALNRSASALFVLAAMLCLTAAAAFQTSVFEQAPWHLGGYSSDGTAITVADEFQFVDATPIGRITWWGGYPGLQSPPVDNFTIRIFADNAGQPGAVLETFAVGSGASVAATGDYVNPPEPEFEFPGIPEFEYSFTLPETFDAAAGARYWLSILNVPDADTWLWEGSGSLENLGVQRTIFDPVSGPWEPFFDNTAFRLELAASTEPLAVGIDIRPHLVPNVIRARAHGLIRVAVLSDATFDAPGAVDTATLTFGPTGDEPSLLNCSRFSRDVSGDGLADLICRFSLAEADFEHGDELGVLKGATAEGVPFIGTDAVLVVP
jgi:hypothetical protein